MIKRIELVAITLAALWPAAFVGAEDHHGGAGAGIHIGGGGGGGGVGISIGGGYHHDRGHHDVHHHGHHGYYPGWRHSDWHHSDWHYVVPHFDDHHHGTYYFDDGTNYYVPQYATESGRYVAGQPVEIAFAGFSHIDDLSGRLERQANQLCLDLHYNYKHNPGFRRTYRAAYQILDTAKYIRVKEHQGDQAEVARRLNEVDGLFHHVESRLAGWSRRNVRQIGQGGVRTKLQAMEATLHHLMHDVGVEGVHGDSHSVLVPGDAEAAPPPFAPAGY